MSEAMTRNSEVAAALTPRDENRRGQTRAVSEDRVCPYGAGRAPIFISEAMTRNSEVAAALTPKDENEGPEGEHGRPKKAGVRPYRRGRPACRPFSGSPRWMKMKCVFASPLAKRSCPFAITFRTRSPRATKNVAILRIAALAKTRDSPIF